MRLIDADALYEEINDIGGCGAKPHTWEAGWDDAVTEVLEILEKAPTMPPKAVNHGKWIVEPTKAFSFRRCSICECSEVLIDGFSRNFCPNCGAKMDGDIQSVDA